MRSKLKRQQHRLKLMGQVRWWDNYNIEHTMSGRERCDDT